MYFPVSVLEDLQFQAERLDRSMSWIMQQAWRIAQKDIASFQSLGDKSPSVDAETV